MDNPSPRIQDLSPTWIDRLSEFLREEAEVEAMIVDAHSEKVSLAIVGEVNLGRLREKLNSVLLALDEDEEERNGMEHHRKLGGVLIRQLPNEDTLLEKPSCPTAPMFWRWREFAWPEPEDLEDQSWEEWQFLAIQAAICGVALLVAWGLETRRVPRQPMNRI